MAEPDVDVVDAEAGPLGPDPVEARPARPPRSTGFVVAVVAAVAFFATTVLLGVVAVGLKADEDEVEGQRSEVQEAAGHFVDVFLQYDFEHPDALDAVVGLTAEPFTSQFEAALPSLRESVLANEHVSSGSVRDVFVADVDAEEATAIVVYDRTLDGRAGPRQETNRYLRLGLVELDGVWRVNAVIDLNIAFADPADTDEDATPPSSTTSTTAPA